MSAPPRIRPGRRALLLILILLFLSLGAEAERVHEQISCARCHGMEGAVAGYSLSEREACLDCHGQQPRDPWAAHPTGEKSCTDCHAFHETAGEPVRAAAKLDTGHCAACHFPGSDLSGLSPGHLRAARLYHEGDADFAALTPSEGCLACHDRDGQHFAEEGAPAVNEHASHAFGVTLLPGSTDPSLRIHAVLDPRIQLFDDRIECATCHRLGSADEDLLVRFEDRYGLCQGCHEQGIRRNEQFYASLP